MHLATTLKQCGQRKQPLQPGITEVLIISHHPDKAPHRLTRLTARSEMRQNTYIVPPVSFEADVRLPRSQQTHDLAQGIMAASRFSCKRVPAHSRC
jgi:hypothetical protein